MVSHTHRARRLAAPAARQRKAQSLPAGGDAMQRWLVDLQRTAGNRATTSLVRTLGDVRPVVIQRYQAGERGHGGIESDALGSRQSGGQTGAGLSGTMTSGEVGGVYLGNWMRDFSQIGDAHDPRILQVLNILSMGEFDHPVTAEQVGGYLPSEHLDNPRGGGSIEDGSARGMPTSDWSGLSSDQQAWVREEQTDAFRGEMDRRAATTHIPSYIEAGKEHARREFLEAATGHRRDLSAEEAVGNGLHTVEDYFAHSNFTDACVYMLARDGTIPRSSPVLQGLQHRAGPQSQGGLGYDPSGGVAGGAQRPEIMTGTYRSEGNKTVSILEQIRSEVETGALREAAVRGAVRMARQGQLDLPGLVGNREAADALLAWEAAGAAIGAVGGAAGGAAHGAAEGWEGGHGLGALTGAVRGAWRQGAAGAAAGAQAGLEEAQTALVTGLVELVNRVIASVDRPSLNAVLDAGGTAQTNAATANDRAAHDTAPNHSQLAKDDVDHPAFAASRALAVTVDRELGRQMIAVWDERERHPEAVETVRTLLAAHRPVELSDIPDSLAALRQLLHLIDTYVSNPADNDWWRPPLLRAVGGAATSAGH